MTCFVVVRKTWALDDQFSILFFSKLLTTIKFQGSQLVHIQRLAKIDQWLHNRELTFRLTYVPANGRLPRRCRQKHFGKTSNLEYVFTVTWLNPAIKMAWSGHCLFFLEGKTRPASLLSYSSETSRNLQPLRKHKKHYLKKLICITYISYILTSYLRIVFWRVSDELPCSVLKRRTIF